MAVEFNPLNSGTQLNSTPNDQSALVWLTTDATHFTVTNVGLSDYGHVGTAQAFAPSTVPEPATLALAAIGCSSGCVALRRPWRRWVLGRRRTTPADRHRLGHAIEDFIDRWSSLVLLV